MTTELTLEFNEDYSFNSLYAHVVTSHGIWNEINKDNFSLTFIVFLGQIFKKVP